MKIGFIGYGNMAKAIAQGLMKENKHHLSAAAPSLTSGLNQEGIHTFSVNQEAIKGAEVIILAVKPQIMPLILDDISNRLPPDVLVISVAAGLDLAWFAKRLAPNQPLIRAMPNTPASIGLGATPMVANAFVNATHKARAELIFKNVGLITWATDEKEMDAFTALSGSGPAYVFLFIEALIAASVQLGLDEAIAKAFAIQTVKGAVHLAQQSDLSVNQLKSKVRSPGGTTAAALDILDGRLEALILEAMTAARSRAQTLAPH